MHKPTASNLVLGQRAIESFDLARSAEALVYVLRGVERGRYVSHLWLLSWLGGRPRRLTHGFVRDTAAAISPDGTAVAFVRASASEDADDGQVWILPLDGGDAWQLTHLPHGASSPRWSPDGRRLAFLSHAGPQRFAVGPERSGKPPMARVMRRTDFRDDESGFLSRRSHLFVTPVREGARPRQVTTGDFDVSAPAWSPDGDWLAFVTDLGADTNIAPARRCIAWRTRAASLHCWRSSPAMRQRRPSHPMVASSRSTAPTWRTHRTRRSSGSGSRQSMTRVPQAVARAR